MLSSKAFSKVFLAPCVAGAVVLSTVPVHAVNLSADFKLDAPIALTDPFAPAEGTPTAGQWLTDNNFYASLATFDIRAPGTYRAAEVNSTQLAPDDRASVPFGQASISVPATVAQPRSAEASLSPNAVHVGSGYAQPENDFVSAQVDWTRSFALDPHSEVTLAGIATLGGGPLVAAPTVQYWVDAIPSPNVNSAYVTYRVPYDDSAGTGIFNTVNLGANILSRNPVTFEPVERSATGQDFAFSQGPGGRLALTVRNVSDEVLYGQFDLTAASEFVSPVPEPATAALLAAGLGVIGFVARRRVARGA